MSGGGESLLEGSQEFKSHLIVSLGGKKNRQRPVEP